MRATFETSITIRMPFGKHRGKTLPECPVNCWFGRCRNATLTIPSQPRCVRKSSSPDAASRHRETAVCGTPEAPARGTITTLDLCCVIHDRQLSSIPNLTHDGAKRT